MADKKTTAQNKKKQPVKSGRNQDARSKNTAPEKTAEKSAQYIAARNQRIAIILMAAALLVFALTLIKGESAWAALHNFIFALFGICSFIFPLILIYITVMIARNSPKKATLANVAGASVFLLCLGGIIHILAGNTDLGSVGDQISRVWDMRMEITFRSAGFFGAVIGGGSDALAGKTGALILLVIIALLTLMLTLGITLTAIKNAVSKPIKKVKDYTDYKIEENHERRNKDNDDNKDDNIIPVITSKKGRKPFRFVDVGPEATPGFDEIRNDDTVLVEELAGNGPKEVSAEENLDNIIKNMASDQTPLSPVNLNNMKQETVKPKKAKKQNPEKPEPAAQDEKENQDDQSEEEKPVYQKPTLECLTQADNSKAQNYEQEVKQKAQKLNETLESFDVNAKLIDICRGPSVTRYELQPAPGVKISKITSLSDDIALAMAATNVRMEAPIPGKAAIGIEIPNTTRATVSLREILETPQYNTQVSKSKLSVAMGKNITGEAIICDIAKMPHLLIAGTTGSGKSVCLNSMIISLLFNASPDEVKLLMIDPKQVEFTVYNGIPHLLVPVVADPKKAAGALGWAVTEMLKRYKMFSDHNVRDIKGYNRLARMDGEMPELPQIVIFIDELSDLMMAAKKEVEDSICRLAQMARAAGMHLVIATQRPSVDVITGIIKANIPSRVSLSVSSQVDSRTILDQSGAETLLGNGDMLYAPIGLSKPVRVQGCFVSDTEVENVVNFIKDQHTSSAYDESVNEEIDRQAAAVGEKKKAAVSIGDSDDSDEGGDEMLPKAIEVVIESQMASTTLLQRKLSLGYARAARLMDALEERGIVGPFRGSKPREVLISREQWMEMNALGNASPARERPYGEEDDEI